MSSPDDESDVHTAFLRLGDALGPDNDWRRKANIARIVGEDPAPMRIGRFTIVDYVGRGAMGQVYAAHDDTLDRRVAIKVLAGPTSVASLDRFAREARALAKLSHPNIVQIHEVGEHDGAMFIAMEFVTGRTLSQWLAPATASWREIVAVFIEAGRGLAAAHAAELVHRDFKPDNVIVGDDGRVRVLDFGLARPVEDTPTADPERSLDGSDALDGATGPSSQKLTKTGSLVGTPAYMAPEQFRSAEASAASDQFSFCVALYEGLYGVRPFAGRNPMAIAEAIESRAFQPPRRNAPRWLSSLVHRGLALHPADRWSSMDALVAELSRRARPRGRWVAAALGGGLAVFGGGLWYQADLGRRCAGGADRIAQTWNDARRQRIRDVMAATGAGFAEETATRVERLVDDYADNWTAQHRETCEATEVRREQSTDVMDRRMSCLDRGRAELDAALAVLAEADTTVAERAIALVSELDDPHDCEGVETTTTDPLAVDDPALAQRAEALRDRLTRIKTLQRSGLYPEAEAAATEAMPEAEAIGHPPLIAEVRASRGTARLDLTRADEARDDLMAAYLVALQHHHERLELSTVIQLSHLAHNNDNDYAAAMRWGETALALSRRPGGKPTDEASAEIALAKAYRSLERYADAGEHAERAIALVETHVGPDALQLPHLLLELGYIRRATDDLPGALELNQRALQIYESQLGPEHPRVAAALGQVATAYSESRQLDEAVTTYQRCLSIGEHLGYPHPTTAGCESGLGLALQRQRKAAEALPHFERALEIYEQTLGAEHPSVARAWNAIADARKDVDDMEGSLEAHERAEAIRKKVLPPGSLETAASSMFVGMHLVELGRYDEGRAKVLEALEVSERDYARHPASRARIGLAMAYATLSKAARATGDVEPAIEYAYKSVEYADYPEAPVGVLTWSWEQLHESLWLDPAQRSLARRLAIEAMDDLVDRGVNDPRLVEALRAWLADHPLEPDPADAATSKHSAP